MTALYVRKVGILKEFCPYSDIDPDWNGSDSSEGIWVINTQCSQGRVTSSHFPKMRPDRTIKEPSASTAEKSHKERLDRETAEFMI